MKVKSLTMEQRKPTYIAGLCGSGSLLVLGWWIDLNQDSVRPLLSAIVTVSSITVGFLATSRSILIASEKKEVVQILIDLGRLKHLVDYTSAAIRGGFSLAVGSAVLIMLDWRKAGFGSELIFSLWVALAAYTACATYRVLRITERVLRQK